jgi:hypothetical protein
LPATTSSRPADPKPSPSLVATVGELTNSTFPYLVLWGLMVRTLGIPHWVTLALSVPATGLVGWTFFNLRAAYPANPRP